LQLARVVPPKELGSALAEAAYERNRQQGTLDGGLDEFVPGWNNYFSDVPPDVEFDFSNLREGLKNTTVGNNQSYRFNVGRGRSFRLATQVYRFGKKNEKRPETRLGKELTPVLKERLDLDSLIHSQEDRDFRVYENVDIVGFRIKRETTADDLDLNAFELKPTNNVTDVLQAVAQAVSYKRYCNYSYIVVPNFDPDSFPDVDRFEEIVGMCRENGVGIISMTMKVGQQEDEIDDLAIVTPPERTELESRGYLDKILGIQEWLICPVCRRIVNADPEKRRNCGWVVTDAVSAEGQCMRELQQANALRLHRFLNSHGA